MFICHWHLHLTLGCSVSQITDDYGIYRDSVTVFFHQTVESLFLYFVPSFLNLFLNPVINLLATYIPIHYT